MFFMYNMYQGSFFQNLIIFHSFVSLIKKHVVLIGACDITEQ